MMAKRLLLRHASRPPSCLLHRHHHRHVVCRQEEQEAWRRRKFASLASSASSSSCTSKALDESIITSAKKANRSTTLHGNSNSGSNNSNINSKSTSSSTNANPNEVNKFSSFATHWWDSRSNPLVGMNPIRIKFLRNVVDTYQPSSPSALDIITQEEQQQLVSLPPLHNKRILDIGCGGGLLTESLSRLGASLVVGVDASTHVVEVAKTHSFHEYSRLITRSSPSMSSSSSSSSSSENAATSSQRDIQYIGGITVEELASTWLAEHEKEKQQQQQEQQQQSSESSSTTASTSTSSSDHDLFDIITALEIIEHVPNPTSLLSAATSLLKPNGILFVSTINRTIKSYGLTIVAAEYILGKVPIGTHTWDMFWSPTEVEQMICCCCNFRSIPM